MTLKEIFEQMIEEDELCNYCPYSSKCNMSIACYGGDPVYPPCADKDDIQYDIESYAENNEIIIDEV